MHDILAGVPQREPSPERDLPSPEPGTPPGEPVTPPQEPVTPPHEPVSPAPEPLSKGYSLIAGKKKIQPCLIWVKRIYW